jgi:hypothetical protein
MAAKDNIKGGLADKISAEDIAKKHDVSLKSIEAQIKMGEKVEMEHVDDKKLAREIALDHLFEIPDYYSRLDKMEKEAKKENITEFARRMRELAGLSENTQKKTISTIQEGKLPGELDDNGMPIPAVCPAHLMGVEINESEEKEFETHKFEQKTIEEAKEDGELYSLNENTIIVLDFLDDEDEK